MEKKTDINPPDNFDVDESLKEIFLELLVAFACIDGELHPTEKTFLKRISTRHFGGEHTVDPFLEKYKDASGESSFEKCESLIEIIKDRGSQLEILEVLSQIADADHRLHPNERRFLNLIKERWKIDVSFISASIELDNEQQGIAEAPPDWKMFVEAGPGTGKTAVACARVSALCDQGVDPGSIWLISFTRAAVQEIRDRIDFFATGPGGLHDVQISTLDSRAWGWRIGFTDDEKKILWGDFDTNIQDATELLDKHRIEIEDLVGGTEHIIIDEAQDILGIRAQFLDGILSLLPDDCGVTVFGDPAQAIYGFTVEDASEGNKHSISFLDLFHTRFSDIGDFKLEKNYRSGNLNLIQMIDTMRKEILDPAIIGEKKLKDTQEKIKEYATELNERFTPDAIQNMNNTLILFRRRAEVLLAASFCASSGVPYRLRMSGIPQLCHAWIATVLNDCKNDTIPRVDFDAIWEQSASHLPNIPNSASEAWSILQKAVGSKSHDEHLKIELLKRVGTGRPNPLLACHDPGFGGPIIGTIHASKGREAAQVHLRAGADNLSDTKDPESEARVLFVGASRAKSGLSIGDGLVSMRYAQKLESGRAYKRQKAKNSSLAFSIEIGRDQDINPYSFVSRKLHRTTEQASDLQNHLINISLEKVPVKVNLNLVQEAEWKYQIWTIGNEIESPSHIVGEMNNSLNGELFSILVTQKKNRFRPPGQIKNLFISGVATFFAQSDDPHLEYVLEPFTSRRYWLVPIIMGFPVVYFKHRQKFQ